MARELHSGVGPACGHSKDKSNVQKRANYEKYDQSPTKNYTVYAGKLMDMDSDYKRFFIRLVLIKPPGNGWPAAAVFPGNNEDTEKERNKLYGKTAVVVYSPLADRVHISMNWSANTVIHIGYFNDSKGMYTQSVEGEHPLFATNSFVGHNIFRPVLLLSLIHI